MWPWRTVNWFAWGGATAPEQFLCYEGGGPYIGQSATAAWGAQTRPLTRYLYPDISEDLIGGQYVFDVPVFHCPQDVGYPVDQFVDDSPMSNAGRPCYTTLGNSYRANMHGGFSGAGSTFRSAASLGPWGHRRSDLVNADRIALGGDAMFGSMTGSLVGLMGWHGEIDHDNVVYCDGSARYTFVSPVTPIDPDPRLPLDANCAYMESRGDTYQLDAYPTPMAFIWGPAGAPWFEPQTPQWPRSGMKRNLQPMNLGSE